jgi:hypothetical protein
MVVLGGRQHKMDTGVLAAADLLAVLPCSAVLLGAQQP